MSAPPLKPCRKTRRRTSAGMGSMAVGVTWEGRDAEGRRSRSLGVEELFVS